MTLMAITELSTAMMFDRSPGDHLLDGFIDHHRARSSNHRID
jgi:hypothetical protein